MNFHRTSSWWVYFPAVEICLLKRATFCTPHLKNMDFRKYKRSKEHYLIIVFFADPFHVESNKNIQFLFIKITKQGYKAVCVLVSDVWSKDHYTTAFGNTKTMRFNCTFSSVCYVDLKHYLT